MTLSNLQCVEVAEKVWGYKQEMAYHGDNYLPSLVLSNLEPIAIRDIQDEVNSWQGFGRTVEALQNQQEIKYMAAIIIKGEIGNYLRRDGIDSVEELWKATHLAAIEAVKEIEDEKA